MYSIQKTTVICNFFFLVTLLMSANQTFGMNQEQKRNTDAEDKPLISLELTGGFRAPPPTGFTPTPFLRIFDDGRVVTGLNSPNQKEFTANLSADELETLIKRISDLGFFDLDSKKIENEIQAAGQKVLIADAPTTVITVRKDNESHAVSVYALGFVAQDLKEVKSLQSLAQIDKLLRLEHGIAIVGGRVALAECIKQTNEYLEKEMPGVPAFSIEHFDSAFAGANESKTITLSNPIGNQTETPGPLWLYITRDGKGTKYRIQK